MLLPSQQNIILEDAVAKLVPLNESYKEQLIAFSLTEPDTWQYSLVSLGGSTEAMEKYIASAIKEKEENKSYPFVVIDKKINAVAGSTRFYDIDLNHKIATIGYTWYGKNFRRTGLNRHCKLLLLDFAFNEWQLERVEFRADINNAASIKAMKEIGCVEEGVLRSHAATENGRRTSIILSILKDEWFGGGRKKLVGKIY